MNILTTILHLHKTEEGGFTITINNHILTFLLFAGLLAFTVTQSFSIAQLRKQFRAIGTSQQQSAVQPQSSSNPSSEGLNALPSQVGGC